MKVSIIIPYNINRGYLEEAIESVKNQTYKNIELLIEAGNCSVGVNLNRGIKKSTGDLIRYVSEDDLLPPNSIKDTVELSSRVKIPFVISGGISSIEDVMKIKSLNNPNIDGVVVGKAIYDGDIKINELAKYYKFDPIKI